MRVLSPWHFWTNRSAQQPAYRQEHALRTVNDTIQTSLLWSYRFGTERYPFL